MTSTELVQVPSTTIKVEGKGCPDADEADHHMDDLDDVAQVSANFEIDDDLMAEIEEKL